jgi:hypothetical protein
VWGVKDIEFREIDSTRHEEHLIERVGTGVITNPRYALGIRRFKTRIITVQNGYFYSANVEESGDDVLCIHTYPTVLQLAPIKEQANGSLRITSAEN